MVNIIGHYGINMTTSVNANIDVNWVHIIDNFTKSFETKCNKNYEKISKVQLHKLEKDYTFSNIINTESFGSYFCKMNAIIDFQLMHPINMSYQQQKEYIIKNYIKCKSQATKHD